IVRRGAPNARRAANVDSASFGQDGIRLATERLSGLVEFPYANAIRKMVVADGIPMKLPSAIANCPGSVDFAKVELPAVKPPRITVPRSPTPAGHVVAFVFTDHGVRVYQLHRIEINPAPIRSIEAEDLPALRNNVNVAGRSIN